MPRLSVAIRKARTLTTFPIFDIVMMIPVFFLLGLARLSVLALPFRSYARRLGTQSTLDTKAPYLESAQIARANRIGRVVRSVARITPWESLCLPQALVASFGLRLAKLPHCVLFGVAPASTENGSDPMDAHAWVMAGDTAVTGGFQLDRFTIVQVFEHQVHTAS